MSDADSIVLFQSNRPRVARRSLRELAIRVRDEVAAGRPFTCLLTNDESLRRLNKHFRRKDYATDVLSFPSGDQAGPLGDIAISLDRAAVQATEHGHAVESEVGILLLHGVLHLLGYDHESDSGRMRRAETRWRKKLGLPNGLIARTARA